MPGQEFTKRIDDTFPQPLSGLHSGCIGKTIYEFTRPSPESANNRWNNRKSGQAICRCPAQAQSLLRREIDRPCTSYQVTGAIAELVGCGAVREFLFIQYFDPVGINDDILCC